VNSIYTIGPLARAAGVHVETVRYYHRLGLLAAPVRAAGTGFRRYSQADAERLRFIKRSQTVGFSLTEIESLLKAREKRSCRATLALASQKLSTVEQRIRDLNRLRRELRRWVVECQANSSTECCPALDALDAKPRRRA
jgi:MerR family mercuric resistance operon transcriptional regulator